MKIVAFIFARGGSKGILRKNLRPLAGKPLLAHAIAAARSSRHVSRVIVSTDDDEIAAVAKDHGAEAPFRRPSELATDEAPERLAWQHALQTLREVEGDACIDVFVSVPTTAPLRQSQDIDACIDKFLEGRADAVIAVAESQRNPYFNMVTMDADGTVQFAVPGLEGLAGRQQAPTVYDITTAAYVARPSFVLAAPPLMKGRVQAVVIPRCRAVDLDDPLDFEIAEFLFSRQQQNESAVPTIRQSA